MVVVGGVGEWVGGVGGRKQLRGRLCGSNLAQRPPEDLSVLKCVLGVAGRFDARHSRPHETFSGSAVKLEATSTPTC